MKAMVKALQSLLYCTSLLPHQLTELLSSGFDAWRSVLQHRQESTVSLESLTILFHVLHSNSSATMMDGPIPITVKSEYDDATVTRHTGNSNPTQAQALPVAVTVATVQALLVQDADVILGSTHRASSVAKHPGNVAYNKLIAVNRDLIASSNIGGNEKLRVAQSIVSTIRAMGGRFLECKDSSAESWLEVSDAKAFELTNNELNAVIIAAEEAPASIAVPAITPTRDNAARTETTSNIPNSNVEATSSVAKREIDPTMLINLSPDQTINLNYPVGSSVLYNVSSRAQQYSSAMMGIVKSVSMDLETRDLLYVIEDAEGNTADESKQFFLEDELAFAPFSAVTIDIKINEETQRFEGEILSVVASNGKKVYSVLVKMERNNVRMFHGVRGNCIRHRILVKEQEQEPCNQKEETEPLKINDDETKQHPATNNKPVANDNTIEQTKATNEVLENKFEVEEVQVSTPQSNASNDNSHHKDKLCSISDGSTAQSAKEVPISQESKSDEDSSSVPSSESSSDAESLFGESTASVCEKFTAGMIDESAEQKDTHHGASQRFTVQEVSRKESDGPIETARNEGSRQQGRRGRGTQENKGKCRHNSSQRKQKNNRGSENKQQIRKRSLSREHGHADNGKQGYRRSSSKGSAVIGGDETRSSKKERKDQSQERKRWTPPQGAIGSSFGSNHIRFDAPAESAHQNKRRRRGS